LASRHQGNCTYYSEATLKTIEAIIDQNQIFALLVEFVPQYIVLGHVHFYWLSNQPAYLLHHDLIWYLNDTLTVYQRFAKILLA